MVRGKKAVRQLMREVPSPDEMRRLMSSTKDRSDYAITMVHTSIIDSLLERLFRQKMTSNDERLLRSLFENRGPLSDLHAKTQMGLALGYLHKAMVTEIDIVRSIRNAFAHSSGELSFENEHISGLVRSLKITSAVAMALAGGYADSAHTGPRELFLVTTILIWTYIDGLVSEAGGKPMTEAFLEDLAKP